MLNVTDASCSDVTCYACQIEGGMKSIIQLRRQLRRILLSFIAVVMSSSGTFRATLRRLSSLAAETNSRPWSARVLHVEINSPLLRGRKATYMANTRAAQPWVQQNALVTSGCKQTTDLLAQADVHIMQLPKQAFPHCALGRAHGAHPAVGAQAVTCSLQAANPPQQLITSCLKCSCIRQGCCTMASRAWQLPTAASTIRPIKGSSHSRPKVNHSILTHCTLAFF